MEVGLPEYPPLADFSGMKNHARCGLAKMDATAERGL